MSNQPIYCIVQRHEEIEAEDIANAFKWKWQLEAKGHTVLSQIAETAFEDWCKDETFIQYLVSLFEGTYHPKQKTFTKFKIFIKKLFYLQTENFHRGIKYNPINYVQRDLQLCAGWLKGDGFANQLCCPTCKTNTYIYPYPNYGNNNNESSYCCRKCSDFFSISDKNAYNSKYDSGLVMLFAPSCFATWDAKWDEDEWENRFAYDDENEQDHWWISKGAKAEYDWAKDSQRNVKCLLLDPFLQGKEVVI